MKSLVKKLLFLVVIIVALFFWFQYKEQKQRERELIRQRKEHLEAQRKREMEAERKRQEEIRAQREMRKKIYEQHKEGKSDTSRTTLVRPPDANHWDAVVRACEKANCRLIKYRELGASSYVAVEGPTHTSVAEFLDYLIPEGMKDLEEHKDKFGARSENGRRIYTAAYTIKW